MRVSDLLTLHVRGDSGCPFGRVHDVRVERRPDGTAAVSALLVGSTAMRERLGGRTSPDSVHLREGGFEIAWEDVTAIDGDTITIRERR